MNQRIIEVRKHFKLSQTKFAESINLTQNFLSLLETGNRQPSDRTISDICRVYGVNKEWLTTGIGEMLTPNSKEAEIARITAQMFKDDESSYRYQLQRIVADLTEEDLELMKRFARKLYEADQNSKSLPPE